MIGKISLLLSIASAMGQTIPVRIIETDHPLPQKDALIQKVANAPTPDAAADALLAHYHLHGYPAVGVEIEDIEEERRVHLDVARYGDIWLTEGPPRTQGIARNHFQDLSNQFVNQEKLQAKLAVFHAHPLHRAVPNLQPSEDGRRVNALLKIEQSTPSRFSAGYHDRGARPLPRERFWFQAEISDLWKTSSLSTARLTISPDPTDFYALQLGSQIYLKNGQEVDFSTSYSGASQGGENSFDAYTWQIGAQWRHQKKIWNSWSYRTQLGLSYRRTNNALEFGIRTVRGFADVFQLSAAQEWEQRTKNSLTRISTGLTISPGGDDSGHNDLRPGARSRYALVRAHFWHRQNLPQRWDVIANIAGQWSSDPIIQGDQIALGGASGLRGLNEQSFLGDHGLIGGLELRTPVFQLPKQWRIRPSFFLQAGQTFDLVNRSSTNAITSGVGLQIGQSENLRASLHAGWRLDEGGQKLHSQLTWTF